MRHKILTTTILAAMAASPLLADFSYQETTTITGGVVAGMMKVASVFSKSLREPVKSTVMVKGNRMAHRSADALTIIDANEGTITTVDFKKKQYTVVTFEDMRKMLEDAQAKMKQNDKGEIKWKVSAKSTGQSKQVSGMDAKEMLLIVEMEATDKESKQSGSMVVTSHVWLAKDVAGYSEMRDFSRKMGEKLAFSPQSSMFSGANQPGMMQGMGEAYKEMSKLEGVPVLNTMVMGGAVPEGQNGQQAQQQPQPQAQPERPSIGGALGGALGGFGLGRKKKQEEPKKEEADSNKPASTPGSLIEMMTEYANFSTAAINDSEFSVPAGFKKVDAPKPR